MLAYNEELRRGSREDDNRKYHKPVLLVRSDAPAVCQTKSGARKIEKGPLNAVAAMNAISIGSGMCGGAAFVNNSAKAPIGSTH
jgi:hypothetical protein